MKFSSAIRIFLISGVLALLGNFVGFKIDPIKALPGMLILLALVIAGYALSKVSPVKLPSIAYISALAIIASIPGVPGADLVTKYVGEVQFLALCTPILAYAGISIGKDLGSFKEQSFKIIIVTFLTFIGTYVGSAIIAQVVMKFTGVI
ncbi:MAG TPA: DUF340 domain-containing protein [Firmicutes bacterium]|nr:DUF340 domain-containing protein [Bacillota bacterium]